MAALAAARSGKNGSKAPAAVPPWEDEPFENQPKPAEVKIAGAAVHALAPERSQEAAPVAPAPAPVIHVVAAPAPAPVMQTSAALPDWDGNWPALVTQLPVRGVAHQLAIQSELQACEVDGDVLVMRLRLPLETLLSAGSADKLSAALSEHFGKTIRLATEIGAVSHTAFAQSQAVQAERQQAAEQTMQSDPFVQSLIREFGATIVPGSIKPI